MNTFCPCICEDACNPIFPNVWTRIASGYRIESLLQKHVAQVKEVIRMHYLPNDLLMIYCNCVYDSPSVTKFLERCEAIMMERASLILIDDRNEEILGCLLLSVVDEIDFGRRFSCVRLNEPQNYTKCVELKNEMQKKIDYFVDYGVRTLMRFYLVCIRDQERGQNLGYSLFRAGLEVARHFYIPLAVTFMTNLKGVEMASHCGFHTFDAMRYDEHPLISPNNYLALMVCTVPSFYTVKVSIETRNEQTVKGKRKKKRKIEKKTKPKKNK